MPSFMSFMYSVFPVEGYSPFITDVRTGELMEPDPDYIEWVKEEMKNTYDTLLADSEKRCD